MNCPQCGTDLTVQMIRCSACGWKIRLSQMLVQTENLGQARRLAPSSDVCYLFADKFIDAAILSSSSGDIEYLISDGSAIAKRPLAVLLCQMAFMDLQFSGHLTLELGASKPLVLSRSHPVVVAKPLGIYRTSSGSLENRLLEGIYDRRHGVSVREALEKVMGFWYTDDPCEWVVRIVRQHLLTTIRVGNGNARDPSQVARLRPQAESIQRAVKEFSSSNPELVTSLVNSIRQGLGRKKS